MFTANVFVLFPGPEQRPVFGWCVGMLVAVSRLPFRFAALLASECALPTSGSCKRWLVIGGLSFFPSFSVLCRRTLGDDTKREGECTYHRHDLQWPVCVCYASWYHILVNLEWAMQHVCGDKRCVITGTIADRLRYKLTVFVWYSVCIV